MSLSGHYLITANVLINYLIARRNPHRIYPYFVPKLIALCKKKSVILYITDFDLAISFLLTKVCQYYPVQSEELVQSHLNEISQYLRIIEINENILETASILTIHPTDAVRVGAAIEQGLDGIVTWDAEHFRSETNTITDLNVSGEARIQYMDMTENPETLEPSYLEIEVVSVNEFFIKIDQPEELQCKSMTNSIPRFSLSFLKYEGTLSRWEENRTSVRVEIELDGRQYIDGEAEGSEGLIFTTIQAINSCINNHLTPLPPFEMTIAVPPLPQLEGAGEVVIELMTGNKTFIRKSFRNDILLGVATAYLETINLYYEEMKSPA